MVEHEIIRDHITKRSRGFGFIVFDSEQVVDNILTDGNMIDMAGTQVSYFSWFLIISDVLKTHLLYSPAKSNLQFKMLVKFLRSPSIFSFECS